MTEFHFHTKPFEHQRKEFEEHSADAVRAILWEQGTGKSKVIVDTGAKMWLEGTINTVLIVAPNGVDENWTTDQIREHLAPELLAVSRLQLYRPEKRVTVWHQKEMRQSLYHEGLLWLAVPYEAFISKAGKKFVWEILKRRRCLYVLDESSNIKTPGAKRTMSIIASGKYSATRRILEGTPISVGPFDLYSQVRFLDPDFWMRELELDTFTAFRAHFGIWRKRGNETSPFDMGTCVAYRNIDTLRELLKKIGSRVLKRNVLDLPEKLYSKRYHEMNSEQRRVYDELKKDFISFVEGGVVTAPLAITQMLRLQQVVCGYVPVDSTDGEPQPVTLLGKTNPRLELQESLCQSYHGQGIVWARFHKDIDQIMDLLGSKACRYDGMVAPEDRQKNKEAFLAGDVQWFVSNPAAASRGHTFVNAAWVSYYSNSFNYIHRQQSEDRCHRIGTKTEVLYNDLVCSGTVDTRIIANLRNKLDVSCEITGDERLEWI